MGTNSRRELLELAKMKRQFLACHCCRVEVKHLGPGNMRCARHGYTLGFNQVFIKTEPAFPELSQSLGSSLGNGGRTRP